MALTITITDPETIQLIQQASERTGETPTQLVKRLAKTSSVSQATQRMGPEAESPHARQERIARAFKTLTEIHELVTDEDRAFDYNAWLYDENGLPR